MTNRESYVVTINGIEHPIELNVRAQNSCEAASIAFDLLRLFPLRSEPVMAFVARRYPSFTDELMAQIYGARR